MTDPEQSLHGEMTLNSYELHSSIEFKIRTNCVDVLMIFEYWKFIFKLNIDLKKIM